MPCCSACVYRLCRGHHRDTHLCAGCRPQPRHRIWRQLRRDAGNLDAVQGVGTGFSTCVLWLAVYVSAAVNQGRPESSLLTEGLKLGPVAWTDTAALPWGASDPPTLPLSCLRHLQYPHLLHGAIAASAPIWNFMGEVRAWIGTRSCQHEASTCSCASTPYCQLWTAAYTNPGGLVGRCAPASLHLQLSACLPLPVVYIL